MSSKKMFAIGSLAGFMLGAIVCLWTVGYCMKFWLDKSRISRPIAETFVTVLVLKNIREGNQEAAIKLLENDLDVHITTLPSVFESISKYQRPSAKNLFLYVKKYRTEYPRKNENAEFGKMVSDSLEKELQD